jgi:HPt (histidine-containing phosphotransfer) domain-containing protein
LAKIIDLYLDNSDDLMDQLRRGIVAGDYPAIGKAAHRFKSSSATLGAQNLTSLCQQLEVMSQDRIMDNPGSILADLETEYTRVRQTLSSILDSRKTVLHLENGAELR